MTFDLKLLAAVLVGLLCSTFVEGALHGVTLKGKLFVSGNDDCAFFTDPDGDAESITLTTLPGGILCDYLTGSNSKPVTITITPE